MDPNKQQNNFQDHLAKHIINRGYTIYGGYVYKRLINGDETNDIDVHVENIDDMNNLAQNLKETFDCKKEKVYWEDGFIDFPPYVTGMRMSCPCIKNDQNDQSNQKLYSVDLMIECESISQNGDIFKLEYKLINKRP